MLRIVNRLSIPKAKIERCTNPMSLHVIYNKTNHSHLSKIAERHTRKERMHAQNKG